VSDAAPIPFGRPWLDDEDRAAVARVLEGHILTHGPECAAFEREFAEFVGGGVHCVSVSSCMAALHLAYLYLGVGPGDEVIVPAQTHVATAHAVEWTGARPVFVDCDPATGNVTAELIEAAVTPRTRAIGLVHYLGIPCDVPAIARVAGRHGLRVVEDCALALGSRFAGTHVGVVGDIGCFSFYPVKHLTTGEGGMLVTRDAAAAAAIARLRAFGIDRTHAERALPGMYDVPGLGLNYRMSELQAALGRSQLRRLPEALERRRSNFHAIAGALAGIPGVRVINSTDPRAENSHYCLSLILEGALAARRDELVRRLNAAGIGTSIYYPQPVPRMTYYREKYGDDADGFPAASELSDASVALPVGPHVGVGDAERIARTAAAEIRRLAA
jgi:dTDP-4-amino-4,6-dideoxygalactose transaminase